MRDVRVAPDIAMMNSADSARAIVLAETVQRELDAARAQFG